MFYKIILLETNISNTSNEIILNAIVDCNYSINDLKDYIILDCKERKQTNPIMNITKINNLDELVIQVFKMYKNYSRDTLLEIINKYLYFPDSININISI